MNSPIASVTRFSNCDHASLVQLLDRYGLVVEMAATGTEIRGSFWGDEEAGLVGNRLVVRDDTPLHSILHEACHFICMDKSRRDALDTNAGGDYDEENAVCYLQILLADEIAGFDRATMMRDMDTWGYTFRLGSARAWFEEDAKDAQEWLRSKALMTQHDLPTFQLRDQ
jgi:hypothetical protein